MRTLLPTVLAAVFSPALAHAVQSNRQAELAAAIVREQNLARTAPHVYADFLQESLQYYTGNLVTRPGEIAERTREGITAVTEAINFLRALEPVGPLSEAEGLRLGALDHVDDHGEKGLVGHVGTDSSMVWDRVNRYGKWFRSVGENIAYGPYSTGTSARLVVSQLIVDDGVADRGHRSAIFDSNYSKTGVACGEHSFYGVMCVITYASQYENLGTHGF